MCGRGRGILQIVKELQALKGSLALQARTDFPGPQAFGVYSVGFLPLRACMAHMITVWATLCSQCCHLQTWDLGRIVCQFRVSVAVAGTVWAFALAGWSFGWCVHSGGPVGGGSGGYVPRVRSSVSGHQVRCGLL